MWALGWKGGTVVRSTHSAYWGTEFSSRHPHRAAPNSLWFQHQVIGCPLLAMTCSCAHRHIQHTHYSRHSWCSISHLRLRTLLSAMLPVTWRKAHMSHGISCNSSNTTSKVQLSLLWHREEATFCYPVFSSLRALITRLTTSFAVVLSEGQLCVTITSSPKIPWACPNTLALF